MVVPVRTTRRSAALVLLAVLLVEVATHTSGLGTGLLHLVPALLLIAPLLVGRYVGEARLAELAVARAPRRARRAVVRALPAPRRAPRALVARGGLLLAARLGVRGPPAPA